MNDLAKAAARALSAFGLRGRLLAVTALALVAVCIALLSNRLHQEAAVHREYVAQDADLALQGLVSALRPEIEANDPLAVRQALQLAAGRAGVANVTWTEASGFRATVEGREIEASGPTWFRRWLALPSLTHSRELVLRGRVQGTASVTYSPRPVENRLWQAFLSQGAFLLATCLALYAVIALLLHTGLRPLHRLAAATRGIERGDYGARVAVSAGDAPELREGLAAFNSMAASLESLVTSLSEHYRAMGNAANITETGLDGLITYANDRFCRVSGFVVDELTGQTHRVVNSAHHPGPFFAELWETISAGRVWRGDVKNKAKDGSHFWSETTVTPILDSSGRPVKYLALRFDITARKENEARLRELNRVIAARGAGFEEQVQAIFDLGRQSFGLDVAVLARIDGDRYHVLDILSPPGGLVRGADLQLSETYCARTVHAGVPLMIEHAERDGWSDHPCFRKYRLQAYIGVPVMRRRQLFGSLAFCSLNPARRPFTDADRDFIRLMGEWAGAEMERREAEELLHREKEHAQVTLRSIGDGVITTDRNGAVLYLNPIAEQLTGWSQEEAQGLPLERVFHLVGDDSLQLENLAARVMDEGGGALRRGQAQLLARDQREFTVEDSAAPIRDQEGRTVGVVVVFRDCSEARAMANQIHYQASHDQLTGLANRREFENRLRLLLEHAKAHGGEHALLYLDLDQFKVVNDTCGHAAGDALLRQVSDLLRHRLGLGDVLARLGGDEFGLLLQNRTLHPHGLKAAEELLAVLTNFRFIWQDKTFALSASIGLAGITPASGDAASVLSAADTACYAAKDGGRKRVQVYNEHDAELARRHGEMHWVSHITKSFEDGRFRLYFQHISPLKPSGDEGDHFELLLRMVREDGTIVPPSEFLPAAERYNLMPSMDRWVIRHAFAAFDERYGAHSDRSLDTCAINISGASLNDEHFLDFVLEQFALHPVPPQAICFEITETVAISNLSRASRFIRELRKIGCRFALDDFGAGMSSFAYLKNLDVDYLKIDGTFVREMASDAVDYAMVEAINRVGQVMEIQTIAEFVENDSIRDKLAGLGVDYVQGYGIHRPEPLLH